MDESCGVEVEEGLGHLVEDVLAVPLGEDVLADEEIGRASCRERV